MICNKALEKLITRVFKQVNINISIQHLKLIFIIPQTLAKIYKNAYKDYKYKE